MRLGRKRPGRDVLLRPDERSSYDESLDKTRPVPAVRTPVRLAKAPCRKRGLTGGFGKAWAVFGLALCMTHSVWAATPAPAGTVISNTAKLVYQSPGGSAVSQLSNQVSVTVTGTGTPSSVAFLTYASGSTSSLIGPTQCSVDGGVTFTSLPAPVTAQGKTLDINKAQPLGSAQLYYPGDPVFVEVTDLDQNLDPTKRETVLAQVSVTGASQSVTVRLTETGINTGVFAGYVLTASGSSAANACTLVLKPNQQLELHYTDAHDSSDTSKAQALVDPYNVVFDSATGQPINGATITLVDATTGVPATVKGRDGVSRFPSSVTSGRSVTDSSGATYSAASGAFLLPDVAAGNYKVEVTPPAGYHYASAVSIATLQQLAGAPYVLGPASFAKSFTLSKARAIGYDIPLDPVSTSLFVQKTASVTTASVGDMIQFNLVVQNTSTTLAAQGVYLLDTLPQGFRYVKGSARLGTVKLPDPVISSDAQQLKFTVGTLDKSSQVQLSYVVEVSAATPLGTAINSVQGFGAGNAASNVATAQVEIQNELMQDVNTIIGRVVMGCGKNSEAAPKDLSGVRILMETGAYAMTDKDGRFHFEAVKNGTHVVQLDTDSLPRGYEIDDCEHNTRHAGRAYSQFVELHGGALWRTDFHIRKLPAANGQVSMQLTQQGAGAQVHNDIDLKVNGVPVSKLSVTVMLPDEMTYIPGSAELDGKALKDPEDMGGALVFRLGNKAAGWHGGLHFETLAGINKLQSHIWITRALANFDTPSAAHQHTAMAEVKLPVQPVYVPEHKQVMVQDYPFARYQIGDSEHAALDKIIEGLQGTRDVSLVITGYTDPVKVLPDAAYQDNKQLGLFRARAVEAYLRRQIGLDWNKVKMTSRAATDPVASNQTDAGRAQNRRITITMDYQTQGVPLLAGTVHSDLQQTDTRGVSPADVKGAADPVDSDSDASVDPDSLADQFKLDPKWLQTASPEPEIIWPAKGWLPAVPSIHVAVKHGPKQRATLTVNGEPVSERNFLGVTRNAKRTIAVSEWLGVTMQEGDNTLVAEVTEDGKLVQRIERHVHYSGVPVRAELVPDKSVLMADGKSRPRIAIRLYDRWGYPARRGMIGRYSVSAPYESYQSREDLQKHQLLAIGPREPVYTVSDDGIAYIDLAPTTTSGQVTIQVPLQGDVKQQLSAWLKPGNRDWILVGLANGTAAFNGINGHIQTLSGDDPNKDIYQDGRVAFYAKGMVKGEYLITAAYDSAKATGVNVNGLQQSVDPNQYFMLYGDASAQGYDASSASKLYLKIERGQFYAMFGDFNTGLDVTDLSRYDRQFNGLKSEYEGKHFKYTAFAARNAQSYVRDDIQGDGTSGLYRLSHQQILLNSEQITIETRDRYHSQRVISSQTLSRYLDYTIDYYSGTIFFKQPVPNYDENFNPVYIVAQYEVTRPGDQSITAGGRAAVKLADGKVEVGATFVNEGSDTGDNKLTGADLRVKFSPTTELKAEVSHTDTGASGPTSTVIGNGLPAGTSVNSSNGNTAGSAYLVSLQNQSDKLESELYVRQEGIGFGLGQQSLSESASRKLGGDARYHLTKNWVLLGEIYREQELQTQGMNSVADAGVSYQVNGNSVTTGIRHVESDYLLPSTAATTASGTTTAATGNGSANQVYVGGSVGVLDNKVTLHGTTNQNVGSSNSGGDPAYPANTTVGADYKLTDSSTLFLNQQFAAGGGSNQAYSRMTEFGVRSTPWEHAQVSTSLAQQMTEFGPRTFSTMGLTQGWNVTKELTLSAGLNRVSSMSQPAAPVTNVATPPAVSTTSEDYTSMFLGGTYRKDDWSWTMRGESLQSSSEQRKGLFGGFYKDLSNGNAFSASLQAFDSRFNPGGDSTSIDGRIGFAHRPDASNWAVLEQLDVIYGNQQGLTTPSFAQQGNTGVASSQQSPTALAAAQGTSSTFGIDQRTWKLVNNLQANYRASDRSQWSIYYGSKYARYVFDSGAYKGYTDLIGSEYRYDLSSRWDIGLIGSRLHTYSSGVVNYSYGVETGWDIHKNMWLSIGYNFKGFYDQDFNAAHYTAKGVFIRFRFKFDQDTIKEMAEGNFF
ncbi:MAG: OmpA family protein [Gammaproteobacteria bacterium]